MTADVSSRNSATFVEHAEHVPQHVKGSFVEVIDALPGHITQPRELSSCLKIDKKLAWKVVNLARGSELFTVARHIPGTAATKLFLKAAAKQGVPLSRIEAVTTAMKDFERLTKLHAGDRATLEMMLLSHGKEDRRRADLAHRKAAFAANSYIWGVQAKTQVKIDFLHPAADQGRLDYATIRGFVGLRRIRPDVPVVIARTRIVDDDGVSRSPPLLREPLDPLDVVSEDAPTSPLLRRFCSNPLARFRRVTGSHGFVEDEWIEGEVGNAGSTTCFTGEVARSVVPQYRTEHDRWGTHAAVVRTPCEALVLDLLVHEDLYVPLDLELIVYGELAGRSPVLLIEGHAGNRLPTLESIEHLGKGSAVVHTPHVPRYAEMIRHTFDKLGWDGNRFDVYRVQIQYPIIPASVLMMHELPEAPETPPS